MQLTTSHVRHILIIALTILLYFEPIAKTRDILAERSDYTYTNSIYNSAVIQTIPAAQANGEKFEFVAYPNPFTNAIYINITPGEEQLKRFRMYDLIGKEVLSFELPANNGDELNYTLNLSDIKPGIYIASIMSDKGVVETRKFVKLS